MKPLAVFIFIVAAVVAIAYYFAGFVPAPGNSVYTSSNGTIDTRP